MMKRAHQMVTGILCGLAVCGLTNAGIAFSAPLELREGAVVKVRLLERLESGKKEKGDRIRFDVIEDVADPQGQVLIRKGAPAVGSVTLSRRAKSFGRRGRLEFTIDRTEAVDGTTIYLRSVQSRSGRSQGAAAVGANLLVPFCGFVVRGGNTLLEPGREFMAYLDSDARIDPIRGAAGAPSPSAPTGAPPTPSEARERWSSAVARIFVFELKDGGRVTGSIEKFENGVHTVVTSIGTVNIDLEQVVSMRQLAPAAIQTTGRSATRKMR